MECQSCDSKKVTKVFDASQRKRSRKKRDGYDDANSVATDDSAIGSVRTSCPAPSGKNSLPDLTSTKGIHQDTHIPKRERDSSPSQEHSPIDHQRSPVDQHRLSRSRRRHHRSSANEGVSLALKAGLVSTPRSVSPLEEGDGVCESIPQDQDSFIYAFLEEAIKRDKKKQRHTRRREERASHDHEVSVAQDHDRYCDRDRERDRDRDHDRDRDRERDRDRRRHHHRHRDDIPARDHDKESKDVPSALANQTMLFETFAKICAQMNDKDARGNPSGSPLVRTQSHKSLQCEVISSRDPYEVDRQPVRLNSHTRSRDLVANRIRSQEDCSNKMRSYEKLVLPNDMDRSNQEKCMYYYKEPPRYQSKLDMARSRTHHIEDDRCREYPHVLPIVPTRSCINPYRRQPETRDYRDYEGDNRGRHYEDDNRKYCEHKTSRSFEVRRDYPENERIRRSARSDPRERRFDERENRIDESSKYYDEKPLEPRERINSISGKDRRWKKNFERFERSSVTSRDDDYNRERDRYSERERDSGLSVADGDTSTISGRSNYLKVVKQQITEQRESMDKMMKLWKELMRCFKGISQTQGQDKNVQESAANAQESATEQMRLWWECMRRYETVARDVGDTDARLMEEIKKQRSEMAEMATMWQECLQRYRDISNDFNSLKQQLVTPESPTRMPAAPPLLCAEGEGSMVPQSYRIPVYPGPQAPVPPQAGGMGSVGGMCGAGGAGGAAGYGAGRGGSPLRGRSSAPPAWWWCDAPPHSPRRRSSPDSRASRGSRDREKDKRHRRKERDESRYKDKPSKPSAARSDHRHRKR